MKHHRNRSAELDVAQAHQLKEKIWDRRQEAQSAKKWWLPITIACVSLAICAIIISKWRDHTSTAIPTPQTVNQELVKIKILKDQTSVVMDELEIRLTGIKIDDASQKYKVNASISTPGNKAMEIQDQEATAETTFFYPQNRKFKIKVISSDMDSATFQIERNSN